MKEIKYSDLKYEWGPVLEALKSNRHDMPVRRALNMLLDEINYQVNKNSDGE